MSRWATRNGRRRRRARRGWETCSHSVRLYALIRSVIRLPIVLLQQPEWRSRLRRAAGYAHHHAIIDALKAGNAGWAESQMQTHIFASLPAPARDSC